MWAVSSMFMNQQNILHKVSLSRNTHKTKLCANPNCQKRDQRLAGSVLPLGAMIWYWLIQCSQRLMRTQCEACMWPSRFLEISWSFSKPQWTSHSAAFPFKLFGWFIVCPKCYPLPQHDVTTTHGECSRAPLDRSDNDLLGTEALKEVQLCSARSGYRFGECGLLVFKAAMELGRRQD